MSKINLDFTFIDLKKYIIDALNIYYMGILLVLPIIKYKIYKKSNNTMELYYENNVLILGGKEDVVIQYIYMEYILQSKKALGNLPVITPYESKYLSAFFQN